MSQRVRGPNHEPSRAPRTLVLLEQGIRSRVRLRPHGLCSRTWHVFADIYKKPFKGVIEEDLSDGGFGEIRAVRGFVRTEWKAGMPVRKRSNCEFPDCVYKSNSVLEKKKKSDSEFEYLWDVEKEEILELLGTNLEKHRSRRR